MSCQRMIFSCQEQNVVRQSTCQSYEKDQNTHRQKKWRDGRNEMVKIKVNENIKCNF